MKESLKGLFIALVLSALFITVVALRQQVVDLTIENDILTSKQHLLKQAYDSRVQDNWALQSEYSELGKYTQELEDYITYLYCPLVYGNAQAKVTYDLKTTIVSTEIMIFKIDGEELKIPPMQEVDCR